MTFPPFSELLASGALEPIDVAFAQTLQRLLPASSPLMVMSAALASNAVQRGHLCLDLQIARADGVCDSDGEQVKLPLPEVAEWRTCLRNSPMVAADGSRPLLLDDAGRLYLARYADYERRLAAQLRGRSERALPPPSAAMTLRVAQLFAVADDEPQDAQRLAAVVALCRGLCVISGGPGTGKTTTVARLLTLLQEQALEGGRPLKVMALAPTGKAAQRLGEALDAGVREIDTSEQVKGLLRMRAFTIHHALGFQPRTPTRFRHGVGNPLVADVVLVDEASMVDVALMTKLVEAVAPNARLILLGDRDQLASVDAGAVFGDVCAAGAGMSHAFAAQVSAISGQDWRQQGADDASPLSNCVVSLTRSYRYSQDSGIGALTRAIKAGDADVVMEVLRSQAGGGYGDVTLAPLEAGVALKSGGQLGALGALARQGFRDYLRAPKPAERLSLLNNFRILSLHRRGPLGVERLNLEVERLLDDAGWLATRRIYYDKRPLMITENDYQLGLFNGDVGVVTDGADRLSRAFFAVAGDVRAVATARLPGHETVFAMTVHKSQGSEFQHVALVLPQRPSPLLTRELIYTAVSRARGRVDVLGSEQVLRAAIARRVLRRSGLVDALQQPARG